jgi:hypothetical protein
MVPPRFSNLRKAARFIKAAGKISLDEAGAVPPFIKKNGQFYVNPKWKKARYEIELWLANELQPHR